MALTKFITGKSLTTTPQVIWTNQAADAKIRTLELRFTNIDGAVSADLTQVVILDTSSGEHPVLPVNATVEARDALVTRIVLNPGFGFKAAASAPGDLYVTVFQVFEEAA